MGVQPGGGPGLQAPELVPLTQGSLTRVAGFRFALSSAEPLARACHVPGLPWVLDL